MEEGYHVGGGHGDGNTCIVYGAVCHTVYGITDGGGDDEGVTDIVGEIERVTGDVENISGIMCDVGCVTDVVGDSGGVANMYLI